MNTRSKSGLFLIELIVVILIFSLSAATCLRLFFQSRQIAAESKNLSYASLAVQSTADCYKSSGGDIEKVAEMLGGSIVNDQLYLYYDADWSRAEDDGAAPYYVRIQELVAGDGVIVAEGKASGPILSISVRGGLDLE